MIDGVSVRGEGFTVSGVSFPQTLEGGESLTLTVRFSPSEDGKKSGNVSLLSYAAGSPAQIALAGNGISNSASGQLSVNPVAFDFGNVPTGNTETRDFVLSNLGGTALTVTQASVAGTNFTLSGLLLPLTLQVGQIATFQVSFTPDTSGAVTGSISLVSDAANSPTVMSLSGDGVVLIGTLAVNPWIIDFGDISAGTSTTQNVTHTNTGNADVTITESTLTGGPGFSASQLSLPLLLAAGQSISFNVTFSPSAAGALTGSVSFLSDAVNSPTTLSLSGAGIAAPTPGQLNLNPSGVDFGDVTVGNSGSTGVTLSNSGGTAISVSSANVSGVGFSLNGLTFPVTIAPGGTTTANVTFSPSAAGALTGSVSFLSDAVNSPTALSLSGAGIEPETHSVSLAWDASTSPNVSGHHVYRRTQSSGPFSPINLFLVLSTTFTDSSVLAGQTYFYVVTAVDANGVESIFSNEATAVVPSP